MDAAWLALGIITLGNIAGWGISYGKLKQKVDSMNDILDNGLVKKVDGMNTTVARLESRVNTFIELRGRNCNGADRAKH